MSAYRSTILVFFDLAETITQPPTSCFGARLFPRGPSKELFDKMARVKKDKSIVSLFSGAMGLDLGLEAAGFRTAVAVEVNRSAIDTIRLNRPRLPIIHQPIEEVSSSAILDRAGLKKGEVTIVSAGPCCQSFSTVGKRKSIGDSRGSLFRHFTRIVADTMPRFFVMENVKGILSAAVKHRPLNHRGPGNPPLSQEEELGSALKIILTELAELNYYVTFALLNAADYGVPQSRFRVIFIGSRDGEDIALPSQTHFHCPRNGQMPWVTLRDAIGNINDPKPEYLSFSDKRLRLLRMLKAGQNWSDLPAQLQEEALGEAYKSWGGRSGFCRRLSWNKPAPTLTTSPVGRATTLCHPSKPRPLTIREYAILQQFPDGWNFSGSTSQKYIQIGNAVPVGLGEAIGLSLRSTIKKTTKHGLPEEARKRKGIVLCADPILEARLRKKRRTQLHPLRLLKSQDPKTIRQWLKAVADQPSLFPKE